jgi:hypothetical protein
MHGLVRACVAWHVVFFLAVIYILAYDLQHQEVWGTWHRNP